MAQTAAPDLKSFNDAPDTAKVRVNTVAALFGVSIPTVWRRARAGLIPAPHKIGGTTVWNVGDLKRALAGGDQ
jgi:predicted DNA-binding transcriptional regulator AlpA